MKRKQIRTIVVSLLILTVTLCGLEIDAKQKSAGKPKLLPISLLESYAEGTDLDLYCIVAHKIDDASFSWTKDGVRLDDLLKYDENSNIRTETVDQRQSILRLTKLKEKDAGSYTCMVENPFGTDSTSAKVVVSVELSWISEPTDVKLSVGHKLSIGCSARGQPKPTITWSKVSGGQSNNYNETIDKYIPLTTNGDHLNIPITAIHHSGWYECKASNGLDGQVLRKVIRVDIQGAPKLLPLNLAESYNEGSDLELFCALASGSQSDRMQFHWLKNGKRLSETSKRHSTDSASSRSILKLFGLSIQDGGDYACIAENIHGTDSVHANLVISVEMSWLEEPIDAHIGLGQRLMVNCSARGQPEPAITWTKLSGPNNKNQRQQHNQTNLGSVLVFESTTLGDSGLYECRASNKLEPDLRKVIEIKVQGK